MSRSLQPPCHDRCYAGWAGSCPGASAAKLLPIGIHAVPAAVPGRPVGMNLWCSMKVNRGLEKLREGAAGNSIDGTAGWPLAGSLEAGRHLSAWSYAELQAVVSWLRAGQCSPLLAPPGPTLVN